MSGDRLVFDLSNEIEGSPNVFIKKDWIKLSDENNGNYNASQCTISTSALSNSNKWTSYREAYLSVPMIMTMVSTTTPVGAGNRFRPATAGESCDFGLGLKNWYGNIIHSISVDFNNVTVIQQTQTINLWSNFRLLTTLSWSDITLNCASMGFYPDTSDSFNFSTAASSPTGTGLTNNTNSLNNTVVTGAFNTYSQGNGNIGFLERQKFINYDPQAVINGSTYSAQLLSVNNANTLWKSYIFNKVDGVTGSANPGVLQYAIMAQIYLKHLHPFFNSLPLLKGVFLKIILSLNQTTVAFTKEAAGALSIQSVSNTFTGTTPFMISAVSGVANCGMTMGGVLTGLNTYKVNLSVGARCNDSSISSLVGVSQAPLSNAVQLYCPAYVFNPIFERAYISSPIKTVYYEDVYTYPVSNVPSGGSINQLLTNGQANLKSVLVIPLLSSAGAGNNFLDGFAQFQSPFDSCGGGTTAPMAHLTNYQVVVSGQNILNDTQARVYEGFMNNLSGCNSVNSNETDGVTSGLISQKDYELLYCYHYIDVSRMLTIEESVPKSVSIIGQNMSARALDLYCYISYGQAIMIDIVTGVRIKQGETL